MLGPYDFVDSRTEFQEIIYSLYVCQKYLLFKNGVLDCANSVLTFKIILF